jgi:hypothetical protein
MSSFNNPHHVYLFGMTNGKKKIGYGPNPDEAYENLRIRLTEQEMAVILKDKYERIPQRDLHKHVHELG